jgi:hypothetical protein
MGFLDHSSNNLILDAVLTDVGRQFLARNDGSFALHKFALGDDEVNYSIIQRYGRSSGKEKIEKNTPIFEAITKQEYAQKYKLISVSNPNLIRLPSITLSSGKLTNTDYVLLKRNSDKLKSLTLEQTIINESVIDVELRDQLFVVEMSNLFLQIQRNTPDNIDANQRATYLLTRDPDVNNYNGSKLTLVIALRSLTDAMFTVYGTKTGTQTIYTYVRVTGVQSGAVKEFRINIENS